MYTTVVGKTFLAEYNRIHQTSLSPKAFFDEELFSIIYDHKRYLWWVQNSPFVQGISKTKPFFTTEEQMTNLDKVHLKVESGERDASIAIGYPASEVKEFATTSGQVSDISITISEDEVYASWIGGALSCGVAGGYALLFNDPNITYTIFEGWKVYRKYLNDEAIQNRLSPNKLSTWNGQWLRFRYSSDYQSDYNFTTLSSLNVFSFKGAEAEINTIAWSRLYFSLSYTFPKKRLTAYVHAIGQTNKTVGFIPFQLTAGKRLAKVYKKLFGEDTYFQKADEIERLLGLHIKRACELGSIGLQALEPKKLRKYFGNSASLKFKSDSEDDPNLISFYTYKTWLITMLSKNKQEISDYTTDIAKALVKYREGARKMDRKNLLEKKMFATKKKEDFLEALIEIVKDPEVDTGIIEYIKDLRDKVHFMNREEFGYFILLLKFDYSYQERQSTSS
ncbi:MAG: hypothetical protein AAF655_23315 [Bacteroidota bacterium]